MSTAQNSLLSLMHHCNLRGIKMASTKYVNQTSTQKSFLVEKSAYECSFIRMCCCICCISTTKLEGFYVLGYLTVD